MFEISKIAYDLYVQAWLDEHTTPELRLQSIRNYYRYAQECTVDKSEPESYKDWLSEIGFNGSTYVCYEEFCEMEYHDKDYIRELLGEDDKLIEIYYKDIENYLDEEALGVESVDCPLLSKYGRTNNNTKTIKIPNTITTAASICGLFEEILEKYDITIPDKEREGAEDEARLYGTTYYALEDDIIKCLNEFAEQNKYNVAKEVDLENFKNALECLDYNPDDYTEAELLDMYDTHFDKLSNNDTYNAIYNEALEDVIREYEKSNTLDNRIFKATQKCEETNNHSREKGGINLEL